MKKKQNLNNHQKKLLNNIAKWTQVKKFYLYGGSALDMLIGKIPHDYDIIIKSQRKTTINKVKKSLLNNKFKILAERDYFIQINLKVKLIYAQKAQILLDIAFMKDNSRAGLFSIESIQWEYPKMEIIDKYGGLLHYQQKKLVPLYNINEENPYLMLGRLMRLASKYNIELKNIRPKKFIKKLLMKLKKWKHKNKFHTQEAVVSCYASFLKSILQSKDKYKYYQTLNKLNITSTLFPELNTAKITRKINNLSSRDEIITYLISLVNANNQQKFIKKITLLSIRNWESKK